MRFHHFAATFTCLALTSVALANPTTYTFHESLHPNQKITILESYDCKNKYAWKTSGVSDPVDSEDAYRWKVTLTIQKVKDGSDMQAIADVAPESNSMTKDAGADEKKTPSPFIGTFVTLTRLADESFTNDFKGKATAQDNNILNNLLSPDEDFYPDKPVAIGDTWDNSAKLSRHSLLGPNDQLLSSCRLDWVKTIDGKPMAQISNSLAIVYHEDNNVEEDVEETATILVDMSSQMIVKADQQGTSTYSNPKSDPAQLTGGTQFTCHDEVLANENHATTKP